MKRPSIFALALSLAVSVPLVAFVARAQQPDTTEIVATEAHNGGTVTLEAGDVLVVRLKDNSSTGYSRGFVSFANMPVRFVSQRTLPAAPASDDGIPRVGAPRVSEWRFAASGRSSASRVVWLKLPLLRPYAAGIDENGLWEIKVTVPATPAQ